MGATRIFWWTRLRDLGGKDDDDEDMGAVTKSFKTHRKPKIHQKCPRSFYYLAKTPKGFFVGCSRTTWIRSTQWMYPSRYCIREKPKKVFFKYRATWMHSTRERWSHHKWHLGTCMCFLFLLYRSHHEGPPISFLDRGPWANHPREHWGHRAALVCCCCTFFG